MHLPIFKRSPKIFGHKYQLQIAVFDPNHQLRTSDTNMGFWESQILICKINVFKYKFTHI